MNRTDAYALSRTLRPHLMEVLDGTLDAGVIEELHIEARVLARRLLAIAEALRVADVPIDLP